MSRFNSNSLPPLEKRLEQEPIGQETPALQMAIRLRFAMPHAFRCPDKQCRRRNICMRPVLECELRPLADIYDWDHGWFNCQRKHIYGVREDSWMPGIMGGTPDFRQEQEDKLMEERMKLMLKNCFP